MYLGEASQLLLFSQMHLVETDQSRPTGDSDQSDRCEKVIQTN